MMGGYSLDYFFNPKNKMIDIENTLFLDVEPTSYEKGKGIPFMIGIGKYYKNYYIYIYDNAEFVYQNEPGNLAAYGWLFPFIYLRR